MVPLTSCLSRWGHRSLLTPVGPGIPPVHLNRCFHLAAKQEREESGKFSVFTLTFDLLLPLSNLGTCSSHAVLPFLRMY